VLLYRIISFWGELPVGWATWAVIVWGNRGSRALAVERVGTDAAAAEVSL
jgi:hypothetical protein